MQGEKGKEKKRKEKWQGKKHRFQQASTKKGGKNVVAKRGKKRKWKKREKTRSPESRRKKNGTKTGKKKWNIFFCWSLLVFCFPKRCRVMGGHSQPFFSASQSDFGQLQGDCTQLQPFYSCLSKRRGVMAPITNHSFSPSHSRRAGWWHPSASIFCLPLKALYGDGTCLQPFFFSPRKKKKKTEAGCWHFSPHIRREQQNQKKNVYPSKKKFKKRRGKTKKKRREKTGKKTKGKKGGKRSYRK